ncbi:protein rolling stone-like [Anastrepha obliqua]|uniref:protein rolling stone-like n=1 Tax=Anastrepha obliqua TaxID=95512 RepID=UPI00240969FB|nr:protein rolling stone-like [Anastrepha obliqua]XP_054743173.1 protein rolling stone-like [Anastrepha obliqua]XP_054743174.1 protein rolling stone-like [Anastrepha obliqua]
MENQVQRSETRGQCCSCCYPCAKLFQNSRFSLLHEPVNDFFKSQWQKGECSKIFLIYRWCFAAWFAVTMGLSLEQFFFEGKWFIYFTNWGFLLCTLVSIYSAILVSIYCFTAPKAPCPLWMVKLYWALHISAFACATGLSFIYWILIYPFAKCQIPEGIHRNEILKIYRRFYVGPDSNTCITFFHNINSHAITSIMMILDQIVVVFPTRVSHLIYPVFVVMLYILFSIVYFLMGGENVIGRPYIYRLLNWGGHPFYSSCVAFGGILFLYPMCLFGYFIYKIRVCLSSSK